MEKEEVKISVRDIVEFILRSGDIDNRRGGWADKESLAKGTRIHKKIQRQMGAAYQAEVPLSYRFCALSLPFTCRSCCSLSRHTSFITLLLVLNPSRKISVFSNNVQRWISPVRFFQNPHDPINRPVLYFPWMPLS